MKNMPTSYLCIGYVPLLYGDSAQTCQIGNNEESKDIIQKIMDEAPSTDAKACLYCIINEIVTPVLAFEKGDEILEHLKIWSEDKPAEWFDLSIGTYKDGYYIILCPKALKSIERFKKARFLFDGKIIDEDDQINIIFKHLTFWSPSIGNLKHLDLTKPLSIGFMDSKKINLKNIKDAPEPEFIGPFEISTLPEKNLESFFNNINS